MTTPHITCFVLSINVLTKEVNSVKYQSSNQSGTLNCSCLQTSTPCYSQTSRLYDVALNIALYINVILVVSIYKEKSVQIHWSL